MERGRSGAKLGGLVRGRLGGCTMSGFLVK
jgi:hypothetical protein